MAVLVPSRGRPDNIARLLKAWEATSTGVADLIVCIDYDDDKHDDYLDILGGLVPSWVKLQRGTRKRLGGTLNFVAPPVAAAYEVVGFMGDDHVPRTIDWDGQVWQSARGAVVYGNDLVMGPNLPTAVFMDARIVRTLGHFVLPGQLHLFMDNYWKTLGEQLGILRYLPEVIIEHAHPIAGKAEWDEGYVANNASDVWEHDERIYKEWVATSMPADIAKVKAVLS